MWFSDGSLLFSVSLVKQIVGLKSISSEFISEKKLLPFLKRDCGRRSFKVPLVRKYSWWPDGRCKLQNLNKTNIFNHKAGEMHAVWRIQCLIELQHDTFLGEFGFKNFCCTRSSLKAQFKIKFLLLLCDSRNAWNKPCGFNALNTLFDSLVKKIKQEKY